MRFTLNGGMIPRTVRRMFDQRHEPRLDGGLQSAALELRGRSHIVQLRNWSASGAMINSPQIPHIGESVSLQLLDRGAVAGHVCWVWGGCIGIRFAVPLNGCGE